MAKTTEQKALEAQAAAEMEAAEAAAAAKAQADADAATAAAAAAKPWTPPTIRFTGLQGYTIHLHKGLGFAGDTSVRFDLETGRLDTADPEIITALRTYIAKFGAQNQVQEIGEVKPD